MNRSGPILRSTHSFFKRGPMVVAHGNDDDDAIFIKEEEYGGFDTADYFYKAGLTKAGLITFKACGVGKKAFLEYFRSGCKNKIDVGFLKGYLGNATTFDRSLLWFEDLDKIKRKEDKPYEKISGASDDTDKLSAQEGRYRTIRGIGWGGGQRA
jgi:hypothetical protein